MKFKLLNAKLYQWCYDDKETDKICNQIKGTNNTKDYDKSE